MQNKSYRTYVLLLKLVFILMEKVRKSLNSVDWISVQIDNNNGLRKIEIRDKYNISRSLMDRAEKNGLINIVNHALNSEAKIKNGEKIKNYYLNNPEKHPWKNNDKFMSKPCELFKQTLRENSVSFVEEFNPIPDRNFSLDIAFPNEKIGIEINGNQHYNRDGSLKEYYQQRHDQIVSSGWTLYEYHYSIAYDKKLMNNIIILLNNNYKLSELNYTFYIKEKKAKTLNNYKRKVNYYKNPCSCGNLKSKSADKCINCDKENKYKNRKIKNRPSINTLKENVKELGYVGTGRKYGVSDNAIRKWLKNN